MNKDKKITSAVVALLLLMGLTVHANRMGRSASFSVTEDSSMSKLNADTDKVNEASVVDEVIWVVGDEPILKSEVEATRLQAEAEGISYSGDPDCSIPEQIALQKLFLHQAAIDSIEVTEFKELPADSIPFVPTEVEVEILTNQPKISMEETNRVKDELRNFTDRVNKGETSFATLARLYSEDPGSARMGGEMDYMGRGMLDPAFANVAFNLTDPKKISKIVESEFGFHIIQLIDKRGDKIKVRHILLKPQVSQEAIDKSLARLDSISADIRNKKFSFEDAATVLSDDKDTRSNKGIMANVTATGSRTSRFQMKDLPTEVARVIDTMKVGQISAPFTMINSRGKTTCAVVKLINRVEGHRATITEDFQVMKDVVLAKEREKTLHDWVVDKIKRTYVRMNDRYKDCKFEYQGWVK